ncbi:AvrD family protein [Streptomyces sp. NPDC029674]|uniref:AvrD family protein n=1 Tax=Streptomyces sp. NPDC029674 TaxID=3365297 RepID=UPI0038509A5F
MDDVLGPRAGRFLGEGFKRAEHRLSGITITPYPGQAAGITATGHLTPPAGPHPEETPPARLSTIDAMLFGAQLTGLYAAHTRQLPADARFAVQRLEMRAGTRAERDEPAKFPLSGRFVAAEPAGPPTATTLECRIGSLFARVHAHHSAGSAGSTGSAGAIEQVYDLPQELPGPWNEAPYGIPHTARQQLLTQVSAMVADGRACARATLAPQPAGAVPARAPATMIDALVAVLQLGQVLLYALDGVEGTHGGRLRMRRTCITAAPRPAARPTGPVTAALGQTQLLPSKAGIWRTAQVSGALHGIQVRADVAHLLPASWPGHDRPHSH